MELALAALPGVITSCLLAFILKLVLDRSSEERQAHRIEVDRITSAHREQITELLQRIQAPEVAVSTHVAQTLPEDPPQPDLDDDLHLVERYEADLERLRMDLAP